MSNVFSYLAWRGDLQFEEHPFSEVDNLILAELSYLNLNEVIRAEGGEAVTLEMIAGSSLLELTNQNQPQHVRLAREMGASRRFRNLVVRAFREVTDEATHTQFAALCVDLDAVHTYVSFRGTDSTIMGWREDFSMSYELMPSQKIAATYLEERLEQEPDRLFYVGGHSKGGNLAVYAALQNEEGYGERIIQVYSNDGPGMCPELVDVGQYDALRPKLVRIVPEFSVIGALFERDQPDLIVKSEESGIMQHDGLSWQISGDHFETVQERSGDCAFYNNICKEWIESVDLEHRESFTKDFFDALEASGAKTTADLAGNGMLVVEDVLLSVIQSEKKTKLVVTRLAQSFWKALSSVKVDELIRKRQTITGLVLFIVGIIFMVLPELASQAIGAIAGVMAMVWLGRKQLTLAFGKEHNQPNARGKMLIQMVLMCGVAFLVAQQDILLRFSNLLIGVAFLFAAYRAAEYVMHRETTRGYRILYTIVAVFAFCMGMVPIVTASTVLSTYVFAVGTMLVLYAVVLILSEMYQNGARHSSEGQNH